MKSALIHGLLLAVMLVYGYRTWTRDKTVQVDLGNVVLWDKSEGDLVSIELKNEKKDLKIERKGGDGDAGYWWGTDTTTDRKAKPPEKKKDDKKDDKDKKDAGSGAGSGSAVADKTGSGSGSGSAVAEKPGSGSGMGSGSAVAEKAGSGAGSGSAVAMTGSAGSAAGAGSGSGAGSADEIVTVKTHEFPLGDNGDKLIKTLVAARALRDLGSLTPEQEKDYKLVDAKQTLTITFKDGAHSFLIGGSPYGNSDRYAVEQSTKHAYLLSKEMITGLEIGESNLHLIDPRGFDATKIDAVTISANDKTKNAKHVEKGVEGTQVKTWGDADTGQPDQTLANFIDEINNLKPTEYQSNTKVADLTPVLKLTYRDERGSQLGTLQLYKHDKPPAADKPDAKPEVEYLIMTEKTRVPGVVRKDTAQRAENDVATVFSDHPLDAPPPTNPHGAPGNGSGFKFNPGKLGAPPPVPQQPGPPGGLPGGAPHGATPPGHPAPGHP